MSRTGFKSRSHPDKMTEKQKAYKQAVKLAERCGLSVAAVSMYDIHIDDMQAKKILALMTKENLLSFYKGSLEEELYEQCLLIKEEFSRRKINVKIIFPARPIE